MHIEDTKTEKSKAKDFMKKKGRRKGHCPL
jgi:hypothetical protein